VSGSSVVPCEASCPALCSDEVQAFGYDRTLHKLTDFVEEGFLEFLEVEPPTPEVAEEKPGGRKKASSQWEEGWRESRSAVQTSFGP
jgi:hypothetical protein